jgi:hypothetical protein
LTKPAAKVDHRPLALRVESQRALGQRHDVVQIRLAGWKTRFGVGLHRKICRVRVARPLARPAQGVDSNQLDVERAAKACYDFDLELAKPAALAIEPVGPYMRAGLGRNKLGVLTSIFSPRRRTLPSST